MTTIQFAATVAFILYVAYGTAFYGEGLKSQGSLGVKTLGFLFECAFLTVLVWVVFWT